MDTIDVRFDPEQSKVKVLQDTDYKHVREFNIECHGFISSALCVPTLSTNVNALDSPALCTCSEEI